VLAAVVGAVGRGQLTPGEGRALAGLLDRYGAAHQTAESEGRRGFTRIACRSVIGSFLRGLPSAVFDVLDTGQG
jgi:hypothetical protein